MFRLYVMFLKLGEKKIISCIFKFDPKIRATRTDRN